jgi:hypothetical protein
MNQAYIWRGFALDDDLVIFILSLDLDSRECIYTWNGLREKTVLEWKR